MRRQTRALIIKRNTNTRGGAVSKRVQIHFFLGAPSVTFANYRKPYAILTMEERSINKIASEVRVEKYDENEW